MIPETQKENTGAQTFDPQPHFSVVACGPLCVPATRGFPLAELGSKTVTLKPELLSTGRGDVDMPSVFRDQWCDETHIKQFAEMLTEAFEHKLYFLQ